MLRELGKIPGQIRNVFLTGFKLAGKPPLLRRIPTDLRQVSDNSSLAAVKLVWTGKDEGCEERGCFLPRKALLEASMKLYQEYRFLFCVLSLIAGFMASVVTIQLHEGW